ncbi:MAG: hypothetical protein R3D98_06800 [Candidatus Krumholzibacteriia bacterium]
MSRVAGYGLSGQGDLARAVEVVATGDHAWRLAGCHTADARTPWPDDVAKDLGRAGRRAGWLLPEDEVTCTQTPLPRLKPRELRRAIHGWVARQEGGAPADWLVSWRTFASTTGNADSQQVAMAYARAQTLASEAAAAAELGVEPGLMLPPSLILDQFFRLAAPESVTLNVWNLVFVGGRGNVLCVANKDGLLLTRPLPGILAADEHDEYVDRLATEVDRSVFFARQTAGSPQVDGVFVCGDAAIAEALQARLRETSGVPCEHWRLDRTVDCGGRELDPDTQLLVMVATLAAASSQYNLAPRSRAGALSEPARRRLLIGAGAAAAAIVPLLIVGGLITDHVQDRYLDQARLNLAVASERAEVAAAIYDRQRLLRAREDFLVQHAQNRYDLARVLRDLAGAAPAAVRFRELQLVARNDGMVLHLTGTSRAREVSVAQTAFMRFQAAVAQLPTVQPLGEPRQLQIGEVDDQGNIEQTVVFTMECRLNLTAAGEEG